jgi:hypothetical protein
LVLIAGIAGVAGMQPPAATGNGIVYVKSKSKELPAGQIRGASAKCPDEMKVVGGGLTISEANTATGVHSSYPIDDGDRGKATDDGWRGVANSRSAGDKRVRTTAVCSKGKFTYVRGITSAPTGANTQVYAPCPVGRQIAGGGVQLSAGNTSLYPGASFPGDADADTEPDDLWYAEANNDSGGEETVIAHAICAKAGTYSYVDENEMVLTFAQGLKLATCPAGTRVTGGGGDTETNTTSAELAQTGSFGTGSTPDDGWVSWFNNHAGVPLGMTTFAICRG